MKVSQHHQAALVGSPSGAEAATTNYMAPTTRTGAIGGVMVRTRRIGTTTCLLVSLALLLPLSVGTGAASQGPAGSLLPSSAPVETSHVGWWDHWSQDRDRDHVDDELRWQLATQGEAAPITLIVDYELHPGAGEVEALEGIGGVLSYAPANLDSLIVRLDGRVVPLVRDLPHVVMVEALPSATLSLASAVASTSLPAAIGAYSLYGDGVVIAIVDTGVDATHQGLDDLDDVNETLDPKVIAFYDAAGAPDNTSGGDRPYDNEGHGTHVSGIAAGTGAPDFVNIGIAPQAQLVVVRIGDASIEGDDAIRGMDWVVSHRFDFHIKVMSLSFGTLLNAPGITNDGNSAVSRMANQAVESGLIVTVSAGNSGPRRNSITPPGDAEEVITVGNVNDQGTLASTSSRGPVGGLRDGYTKPDVCAPGTDVYSAQANDDQGIHGDGYVSKSGTSMSAPFVGGLSALMLQADPALTPQKVKQVLQATGGGQSLGLFGSSPNNDYGYGIVDPKAALDNITTAGGPPRVHLDAMGSVVSGVVTISGTAESPQGTIQRVEVRIGSGEWKPARGTELWTYAWDTTTLPNGAVMVSVRSYDGNTYSGVVRQQHQVTNLVVTIDSFDGPINGIYRVLGTASGPTIESVAVRIDGGDWQEATAAATGWAAWSFELDPKSLAEGDHTLEARARTGELTSPLASIAFHVSAGGKVDPGPQEPPTNTTRPQDPWWLDSNVLWVGGGPLSFVVAGVAWYIVRGRLWRRRKGG